MSRVEDLVNDIKFNGNLKAEEELVDIYLPVIKSIARKFCYLYNHKDYDSLVGQGLLVLIETVRGIPHTEYGVKTYIGTALERSMRRHLVYDRLLKNNKVEYKDLEEIPDKEYINVEEYIEHIAENETEKLILTYLATETWSISKIAKKCNMCVSKVYIIRKKLIERIKNG